MKTALGHASERVVCASQVTLQVAKGGFHQALHLKTLLLSDARAKAKPRDASAHPYPGALDRGCGINVALDVVRVHVRGVHSVWRDAMIFLDERIKDFSKVLVAVPVSSIDATVLVVKLDRTSNCLCQSEATGCGLHTGKFVPQRLRHVLGHQRVRGLDLGEGFAHGGGGGVAAVEIEGDGKEKAALLRSVFKLCK